MSFYIQNIDTGLVLDIKDGKKEPHGEIIMCPLHGRTNQLWTYHDGMIYSEHNGMVLDINRITNQVITYPMNGGPNQKWLFEDDGIVSSRTGQVLDVEFMSRRMGAKVIAWSRNGCYNQIFKRVYVKQICEAVPSPVGQGLTTETNLNLSVRSDVSINVYLEESLK